MLSRAAGLAIALTLIGGSAFAAIEDVPLASLDLSKMTAGWGTPQIDKAVTGGRCRLAVGSSQGRRTHADSISGSTQRRSRAIRGLDRG